MKKLRRKIIATLFALSAITSFAYPFNKDNLFTTLHASNPTSGASYYTDPTRYYQGINEDLVGEDLMVALSTLTSSGFQSKSYSSLPSIYQYSDVSLTNPSKMVMYYTGTERDFNPGSMPGSANKEHVWPASWYGTGDRTESAGSPGADAHNIWPAATDLNSKRGSAAFDELPFNSGTYKALEFGSLNYAKNSSDESYFWSRRSGNSNAQNNEAVYPPKNYRGQVARTLMYVATRYRNDNRYPVKLHDQGITLKSGRIGKLSTLLKWHYEEPPSAFEIKRNIEIAARWHNNRNPFVDHPEYATRIFYYLPEPDQNQPTQAVKDVIETYADLNPKIVLDKNSAQLEVGKTLQVNISKNPLNETIVWSSTNENVASVTQNGLITALSEGTSVIKATGNETEATLNLMVVPLGSNDVKVTSISFGFTDKTTQIGSELSFTPTITPSNATNKELTWTSSNTAVATVDEYTGNIVALNKGTTTIRATTTDGTNISAFFTLTVNDKTIVEGSGWLLVEDAGTLQAGDRLVIASSAHNKTAGELGSSSILASLDSTFASDKKSITTLNSSSLIFTLDGSSGAWHLKNENEQKLGDQGEKKLAWDTGTLTWTISIASSGEATIKPNSSATYTLQYNSAAPRFTTYNSSQVKPQIYRYTEPEEDSAKELAYAYISRFMALTAEECLNNNVLFSTWNTLEDEYEALSDEVKDFIFAKSETDSLVSAFVARYRVIIENYPYSNFLANSNGELVVNLVNTPRGDNSGNKPIKTAVITFLSVMLFMALLIIIKVRRKKTN